jgi:hypothetical protein
LNDLLLEALEGYWNWVRAYNQLLIYREFIDLALERFDGIRESFTQGDLPAIDTLEAFIQVQNRRIGENQSFIELSKSDPLNFQIIYGLKMIFHLKFQKVWCLHGYGRIVAT